MKLSPFERATKSNAKLAQQYSSELRSIRNMAMARLVGRIKAGETNMFHRNHRLSFRLMMPYKQDLTRYVLTVMLHDQVAIEYKKLNDEVKGHTMIDEDALNRIVQIMYSA